MKAIFKWPGGSGSIVPIAKAVVNAYGINDIFEPFAGSAKVSFGIEPERAYLNDVIPYAAWFYEAIQDSSSGLFLDQPHDNEDDFKSLYYQRRTEFNQKAIKNIPHQDTTRILLDFNISDTNLASYFIG